MFRTSVYEAQKHLQRLERLIIGSKVDVSPESLFSAASVALFNKLEAQRKEGQVSEARKTERSLMRSLLATAKSLGVFVGHKDNDRFRYCDSCVYLMRFHSERNLDVREKN